MEYIIYSLVVLAALIALFVWLQLPRRYRLPADQIYPANPEQQRQLAKKKKSLRTHAANRLNPDQHRIKLDRDLSEVRTPWGWPHCEKNSFEGGKPAPVNGQAHSISDSLHHWADKLAQGKRTVDDEDYRHKKERCMRVMLEDRFGRSALTDPATREKPRGDPMPAHNKTDNFSSGQAEKAEARFARKSQSARISRDRRSPKLKMQTGLENVKMPWGW